MLYFSHPACLEHDPRAHLPSHPDSPQRLRAIEETLDTCGWLGWERRVAPQVRERELELVHTPEHVRRIRDVCLADGGAIDADTFVGAPSYRAALHAAGGACEMVRALLSGEDEIGFCGVRPAGHHAEPDRAMGFCLFDNVAVAAALAIAELGIERVFILDWDVHHGNGTAETFRRRSDVLFASIHQRGLYPGSGAADDLGSGEGRGYTINLPVPPGSGEEIWVSLLEHILVPVARMFAPQLILISAGFDAHREDPLGDCDLTARSFGQMACHVRDLARELRVPVGGVLEGGYEIPSLVESVLETMGALGGVGIAGSIAPEQILTPRAAKQIAPFWQL